MIITRKDTELKLAIGRNSLSSLKDRLISVKPKGITPLAYTLEQTKSDFAGLEGQKNILVLITDGSESCTGDPCAILEILLQNQVIIKPVVIGLDIDIASLRDYHCIQDVFNPHSPTEFERNVLSVVHQAINYTSLQVKLLDYKKEAKTTNLPMLFYNSKKELAYSFYHKLNKLGQADTILLEPTEEYSLVIGSLPPITKEGIHLSGNTHNIIEIPAPLCNLEIKTFVDNEKTSIIPEIPYFIKQTSEKLYFYQGETNKEQNYLYGSYDIDIMTLPITRLTKVALEKPKKEIKLAAPGKLIVNAKFPIHAALFTEINKELVNIYTFKANSTQEILDLQPGIYSLVYRFDHKRKMTETQINNIVIQSKEILEIKL
ncbi:MAG: hypothetical protein R2772_04925 [Chitinophagales bacterium]